MMKTNTKTNQDTKREKKRAQLLIEPQEEASTRPLKWTDASELERRRERRSVGRKGKLAALLAVLFVAAFLASGSSLALELGQVRPAGSSVATPPASLANVTHLNDTVAAEESGAEEEEAISEQPREDNRTAVGVSEADIELDGARVTELGRLVLATAAEMADRMVEHARGAGDEATVAAGGEDEEEPVGATIERLDAGSNPAPQAAGLRNSTSVEGSQQADDVRELKLAMDTYAKWRTTADDLIELFSRKLLPLVVENGYDVDAVTVTGLLQVFNGIRGLKGWALRLLDASAKLTPGLLVGTQSDFGDFDECLNVRVDDPAGLGAAGELDETTGLPASTLIGRYCLADVEFPKPPRARLSDRDEPAPIELRRPLLNFSESAQFKDTIFVETGNFFHMLYVDPIRVGICLTNKIDPDSFAKVLNKLLEDFRVRISFHGRCTTKYERPVWTVQQRVSAYVLLAACSLVLLCTLLDVFHAKLAELPLPEALAAKRIRLQAALSRHWSLFTSFSILRNTSRLLSLPQPTPRAQLGLNLARALSSGGPAPGSRDSPPTERRSSESGSALNLIGRDESKILGGVFLHEAGPELDRVAPRTRHQADLLCLHGIRVITMTWMIVNHTYLFGGFFVLWAHRRLIDIAEWPKSASFQLVLNGWLTVETYFFLSAAIIVLNVMPLMQARKFSLLPYILHRLVRLLPAYTGLICLNFLWPLLSSGPVWLVKGRSFIQAPCENYLWTNYLFINNWIWPEKQCMVHTWFLSADFQLYLAAPIVVYLLYRKPVLGHAVNITVAIVASVFSGFVIYANKLMPSTLINKLEFDSIKQQLSYSYFATYQHMGPYCLGLFIGYLLHNRPQLYLPRYLTWTLWLLLPPLSFTTLLLTYLWNGAYDEPALINPSPLVSALYVAIHRTIWTSLLAWVVFACSTGRASLISSFLSHSMFIPLSRLSFSVYLVHLPVIMFRALNLRHTIEWTDSNILWEACGNLLISLIVGYFVNVAFESPIINLERLLLGGRTGNQKDKQDKRPDWSKPSELKEHSAHHLQPQTETTRTSSDGDSDDCQSNTANSLAGSGSSPPLGVTAPAVPLLPRVVQRPLSEHRGSTNRKALRPKQKFTVERIFGQVEPLSPSGYLTEAPPLHRSPLPNNGMGKHQRAQQVLPSTNVTFPSIRDFHSHKDVYTIPGEHQHYAWPESPKLNQYATLARTSRFDHESLLGKQEFRSPLYTGSKPRSQLGGSISAAGREPALLTEQQHQVPQRRQRRYNTLTGSGGKEWREHFAVRARDGWSDLPMRLGGPRDPLTSWLQPGALIPRIDSSTLRRHAMRADTTGSIVEEPTYEEQEDFAL